MSTDPHHLDIKQIEDITVVTFPCIKFLDFDVDGISHEQLLALVDENREEQKIVLDLGLVEYATSKGLGTLFLIHNKVSRYNKAKDGKAKLRLCGIRRGIMEIFELCHAERIFDIKPTLEEALEGF